MTEARVFHRGATEYLDDVWISAPVEISSQIAHFSFDNGTTWLLGEFVDPEPALERELRILLVVSTVFATPSNYTVLVRVTDSPETPIIECGTIVVR